MGGLQRLTLKPSDILPGLGENVGLSDCSPLIDEGEGVFPRRHRRGFVVRIFSVILEEPVRGIGIHVVGCIGVRVR